MNIKRKKTEHTKRLVYLVARKEVMHKYRSKRKTDNLLIKENALNLDDYKDCDRSVQ